MTRKANLPRFFPDPFLTLFRSTPKSEKALQNRAFPSSGAEESRTPDLIIANDALYQLSYRPDGLSSRFRHAADLARA